MSLAVLADHMASKGRGPDSMLIHMSPREVQGLQALAENHGGSLTINPETGLPEAGFLDKLLPTIIGAGLTFFGGVPPNVAAMIVGGIQTARTGDLGKGIQAGLGAYSGASLTSGLTTAGAEAIGGGAAADAYAGLGANAITDAQAISQGFGSAEELMQTKAALAGQQAASTATPLQTLSAGASKAATNPMQYLKANAMPLAGAFGPAILAGMSAKENMPKTTTGMIRPYSFDPYSGSYTAAVPYPASPNRAAEGGLMGLANGGMAGYEDDEEGMATGGMGGMFNFAQQSEPVVRMAEGGIAGYAGGDLIREAYEKGDYATTSRLLGEAGMGAQDVVSKYGLSQADAAAVAKNLGYTGDMSGIKYAAAPPAAQAQTQTAVTTPTYTYYTEDQMGSFLSNPVNKDIDLGKAIKDTNADPAAVNRYIASLTSPFVGSTESDRGSGTFGIYNNMVNKSISPDEYYAAAIANDPKYGGWSKDMIQEGYNLNKAMYALSDAKKGVVTDTDWAKLMVGNGTWDKPQYDPNEMAQATGLSIAEVRARYELEKLKANPIIKTIDNTKVTGTGTTTDTTTTPITYKTDGTNAPGGLESIIGLPPGVSGAGITTVNPNGTITTRPDLTLPMSTVRDDYVRGGGNLGYTSPTFASLKAVEDKYPLRGGSKQSYDFLTGKTDYDPKPYTKTGELMKPYSESVLGIPIASSKKMYLFDPATKTYKINPDYAIPTYDKDGKKSYNLTNADVTAFMNTKPSTDAFYTWATTNNLSPEQIAQASGRSINEISKLFMGAKDLVGEDGKIDQTKLDEKTAADEKTNFDYVAYLKANPDVQAELDAGKANFGTKDDPAAAAYEHYLRYGKAGGRKYTKKAADGGLMAMARGGMAQQFNLGDYSDGGRLLRGPGDGVSDSIPASIGGKRPARLADGEFVVPARIVSELGNGSTEAGARKLYAMMDRIQSARRGTVGKGRVAKNSRSEKYLPA